jgi:hypothetical protein
MMNAKLWLPLGAVASMLLLALVLPTGNEEATRVAFIGNSVTFVNDLPRLVEALGGNSEIVQDSCLHGSLNLMTMLQKGNGMYNKWQTQNAQINNTEGLYDFGACSVPQLLLGHDEELYESSSSGKFSDGRNPCTLDSNYLAYRETRAEEIRQQGWDFVVVNDQSRYPTTYQRRQRSLLALRQAYTPLLLQANATVVFLVTYGYIAQNAVYVNDDWRDPPTETEEDIPYFTSLLYHGYQEYQQILRRRLVRARLAPVGLAYLTVYEESRELWRRLFFVDGLHPSPLGTFLSGCVVYATIFRRLPPASRRIGGVSQLWARSRRMHLSKSSWSKYVDADTAASMFPMALPTRAEAQFLSHVCRRVALEEYLPPSLWAVEDLGSEFTSQYQDTDDGSYYGHYMGGSSQDDDFYNFGEFDDDFVYGEDY